MNHGVANAGLSILCETCESDIDFPDDYADLGVCRQCGVAFLIDAPPVIEAGARSATLEITAS